VDEPQSLKMYLDKLLYMLSNERDHFKFMMIKSMFPLVDSHLKTRISGGAVVTAFDLIILSFWLVELEFVYMIELFLLVSTWCDIRVDQFRK
jgi:hypothetical protein